MTIQSNKTVLLGDGRRIRAAGLVRCLSGLTAGWRAGDSGGRPGARRGSTLILIIGVLALLSVVILSYFLIGKADRRTGAVAVRKENISGAVERVGEYIASDIIANDVFSMFVEGSNPDFNPANRYALLVREAWDYPYTDPQRRSQPTKDPSNPAPGTAEFDRFRFDPSGNIPRSFNPVLGPDQNKILNFPGSDPWLAASEPTCLNPLPDEPRYDNSPNFDSILENSRDWAKISNIAPDGRFVNLYNLRGRFDAESGFTGTNGVGSRISDNLVLLNDLGQATFPLGSQKTDYGVTANPNIPSQWDSRLQRAFRPVGSAGLAFNDPAFPDYQWADTDGDGFYDAKWQELVDATDPNNPISLLPKDGRFRWFVAARIVDLSARVNVNVATDTALNAGNPGDTTYGVNGSYRAGMSPADVNLRSLLTLEDSDYTWNLLFPNDGYAPLKQGAPGSADDYSAYNNQPGTNAALTVGASGYNGIAATIGQVLTPRGDYDVNNPGNNPPLTAKDRYDYYRLSGGFAPGEAGFDGVNGRLSGLFGLPDLIELLTYRGVNDPANRSRLENAIGGRFMDPQYDQFSPLRDNRSLEVERSRATGPYGQATIESLMWSALDIRQRLTTVSGARPLRSVRLSYIPVNFGDILLAGSKLNNNGVNELPTDAVAALRSAANNAPFALFKGYCDALLPFSADLRSWDISGAYSTLAYGYDPAAPRNNPETALRIAAAMTANMTDLYDSDSTPKGYTLLLDGSAANRGAVAGDAVNFPWWSTNKLDLDNGVNAQPSGTRLTDNAANNVTAKAINVYGIEAQPFITQVATFQMYSDYANGDNDYGPGKAITINGSITNNNQDFIFQCIAFQLNNPFDEPVDMTGYTFEFGRYSRATNTALDIVSTDPVNGGKTPVTLQPHETRTFYVLSQPRAQILARMKVVDPTIDANAPYPTSALDKWVENQLNVTFINPGPNPQAIMVPNSNGVIPLTVKFLMAGTPGDLNQLDNREFRLWRPLPGPSNTGLLVDRIRDPQPLNQRPSLDSRLNNGQNQVTGTTSPSKGNGDDTGYSITTWGWIRRADDRGDSEQGNLVPKRALPAWTVECKFGTTLNPTGSLNDRDLLPSNPASLAKSTFTNKPNAAYTFNSLINDQAFAAPGSIKHQIPTIMTNAEEKAQKFPLGDPDENLMPSIITPNGPVAYENLYAEPHLENNLFRNADQRSVLRPADMLLALAVGPWQDPKAVDDPATKLGDDKWTTLGESLAMALGYDDQVPNDDAHAPYHNMRDRTDRGSLCLDKFVPFVDKNNNFVFDANIDPNISDERRGLGIPLALNLFDVFTTMDPQFGSLNRPTVGTINPNTAPEMVLRCIPMLSPPYDTDLNGFPQWFWPSPSPLSTAGAGPIDVAATIAAYRDKSRVNPRGTATDVDFVGPGNVAGYFNDDPNAAVTELYGRGRDPANANFSPTGIQGIRETPGIMSKGELLAVRDHQFANPGTPQPSPHDMDRLGYDKDSYMGPGQSSLNKAGVDSVRYVANAEDDQIQNDYDEKLAVANGVMNSVSVRSDIFAATFIVHGYQKSDCVGLTDRDPLVPSVARRYLMIVDRSNVVRTGDKPRILVFKELPLK